MQTFFEILKAVVQGIVEGVTEWLPISSTGHIILLEEFLRFNVSQEFFNVFKVVIQLGAIMAVVILYFHRLNPFSPKKTPQQRNEIWHMWFKVAVATIPAAVIGFLFDDFIDEKLSTPIVIAATLIIYGILFIWIENQKRRPTVSRIVELNYTMALYIGGFQMLALIPGTSRSGATILGAILLGASRPVAAEFSFFMSIPVMFGASLYKILDYIKDNGFNFTGTEIAVLLVGTLVSFIVSVFVIKFLMSYIKRHDFKVFGYYRIALGIVIILYFGIRTLLLA
ncbi:MAG TPA: undecaprenyl-diphosphate phosphatase [Clostridiales bacterium]|nr:undecaprenyl-diphosphate phosphatase [Clostridiales bacterium]